MVVSSTHEVGAYVLEGTTWAHEYRGYTQGVGIHIQVGEGAS